MELKRIINVGVDDRAHQRHDTDARLIGYARKATGIEDNLTQQKMTLTDAGCLLILTDIGSGFQTSLPGWSVLLAHILPGDTIVVTDIDRLSRSILDLVAKFEAISKRGGGLALVEDGTLLRLPRFGNPVFLG